MKKMSANSYKRFFMRFLLLGIFFILSCGGGSGDSDNNTNDGDSDNTVEIEDVSGEYTFWRKHNFEATSYSIVDGDGCINESEGTSEIGNFQLTQDDYEIIIENESSNYGTIDDSNYVHFIYEDLEYTGFYDDETKTIEGSFLGTTTEEDPITGCISTGTITGTFKLTRTPVSVSITGPAEVEEGEGAQYTCTAYYSNGSSSDVSSSAQWRDDSTYAIIDTDGYLTTTLVSSDQTVTITANYGELSDTKSVTIQEVGDPIINPITEECENSCKDLSGNLEMQVLVGPAESVGLEPFAVGKIPFSTECNDANLCLVKGEGKIDYEDIYEAEWGTYTVTLDMAAVIGGECDGGCSVDENGKCVCGNASLSLAVEVSGEQLVQVRAEGFNGDYPWSGTHTMELAFPLEEGATAAGEGWSFELHLDK